MRDFAFGQGAQDKSSHIHTKNHSSLVLFQTKDKDRHRGELLMMAMATKLATISPGILKTPSNDCTVFDLDKFIYGVLNYLDLNYCDPHNTVVYEKYLDYQDFDY